MSLELTLNYHLRWDRVEPWYQKNNQIATFMPGQTSAVFPGAPPASSIPPIRACPGRWRRPEGPLRAAPAALPHPSNIVCFHFGLAFRGRAFPKQSRLERVRAPWRSTLDALDFAAIHPDGSSREPTGFLGNQVRHQAGNLLRFAIASDAGLLRKLPHGLFHTHSVRGRPSIQEGPATARHNRTRHYAIDLDSILDALFCERLPDGP